MGFFPSGRQHYHEPLPLRRPTFIDNPSSFSQCKRSHRPSPLDLAEEDTEAKAKLPVLNSQLSSHALWVQLLAEFNGVVGPESAWDHSPLSSPVERRSLDVDRQLDSETQPSEQGYILVSPLSVLGSTEPTFCVSPLDEHDTAHTDTLGEYEFVLASASTESESWSVIAQQDSEDPMSAGGVSVWSNPFSDEYEDNSLSPIDPAFESALEELNSISPDIASLDEPFVSYEDEDNSLGSPISPSLESALEELNSMSPDNFSLDEPFVSAQEQFGPSSNPFSPNYEYTRSSPDISPVHRWTIVTQDWSPVPERDAVSHFSDDSSDDGLEIQHVRQRAPHPPVVTPEVSSTNDGVDTVGYVAYPPRPFLTRSAGGGYGYITNATLPASRYGTFDTQDPSTPRSPWVDENENSRLLRAHTMDEHLDGGCSAWDDVFFIVMSLLFFAVSSIYVFMLLSVLQHLVVSR